jgi:hypothetical protein
MLRSFTVGSILHLLADLFRESAERTHPSENATSQQQLKAVEATVFVVGFGFDAACLR